MGALQVGIVGDFDRRRHGHWATEVALFHAAARLGVRNGQAPISADEADTLQEEFEKELADVLGQVLVLASLTGVNLSAALERKWLRWHPDRSGVVR